MVGFLVGLGFLLLVVLVALLVELLFPQAEEVFIVDSQGEKVASMILTDIQKVSVSLQGNDAAGNPAVLVGTAVWSVDDATILSVTPSADTLSAELVTTGKLGSATVSATFTPTGGPALPVATLSISVGGSEPTTVTIVPGTPVSRI